MTESEFRKYRRRVVAALVVTGVAAGSWLGAHFDPPEAIPSTDPMVIRCHEDEPCWNCETMGNHICGEPKAALR